MYTRRFDGFCLVSSDSDFTRLAQRLREEGHSVYGFGERKTPDAFVQACDKFIYAEVLRNEPTPEPVAAPAAKKSDKAGAVEVTSATPPKSAPLPLPRKLIEQAIEESSDDAGWAHLSAVGSYLNKVRSDFDPRLYGQRKLSDLIKAHGKWYEIEERGASGGGKAVYVRLKA
jgi:hypothetical protein